MKKLPIGIQSFSELINGGYTYVDKTELIFNLLQNKTYFLSRPRRFGKSLLINTLKEIFLGNKSLFKGLWIYDKIEFRKHPVIHLDFSGIPFQELGLKEALRKFFIKYTDDVGVSLESEEYSEMFPELIEKLSANGKVVILIDEYDKPIIHDLTNTEFACAQRDILKYLFAPLKSLDQYIQFLFITGVSKFSMVSIFSDLNHLDDISLTETYGTLVGLTEEEIVNNFPGYIDANAVKFNIPAKTLVERMRTMYNGYYFNAKAASVYNPFSVLKFFKDKEFRNYWFGTGTPTFLVEALRNRTIDISNDLPKEINDDFMDKFDLQDIDKINIWTLLYQTGYLTIKNYDEGLRSYLLDFPNEEVKNAFLRNLLEVYAFDNFSEASTSVIQIHKGLLSNNWGLIVQHINIIFAGIPYQIFTNKGEYFYHAIIHTIISLTGADTLSEVQTSKGRIDCLIKTPKQIYIVEFKIGTPETALQQIEQNQYFKQFTNDSRPIHLVGVGFDLAKKEISGWLSKAIVN